MKRYLVEVRYSTDGRNWGRMTVTVTADSEFGARTNALGQFAHYRFKEVVMIRRA